MIRHGLAFMINRQCLVLTGRQVLGDGGGGTAACARGCCTGWGSVTLLAEPGEREDRVEQERVDAGLLVGGATGAEVGDGGGDTRCRLGGPGSLL